MPPPTRRRPRALPTAPFFVAPLQLFVSSLNLRRNYRARVSTRCARPHRNARFFCDASSSWQSRSSSALNQEGSEKRYIDLRTMKVIHSDDAHIYPGPTPGVSFGVLDNPDLFADPQTAAELRDLLFTQDTVPLSDSQRQVVEALLSKRSALYMSAVGEERVSIFVDIVMRTRLWKECIVYCASSRRSAEALYATLCAQLGPERKGELLMDFGDGTLEELQNDGASCDGVRVIFTSPEVLKTNLVMCDSGGWISNVSIVFMDNFSTSRLSDWEEILLAMPSRVLLCMFAKELTANEREFLPLWLESIQNRFVSVSPPGAASLLDRIERPQSFPLLRTFAYNAAVHDSPVQVSLTLLKDMMQKENEQFDSSYLPMYEECFLQGITTIPAEDPSMLEFATADEAEYADVCALIVADAKRTEEKVQARAKRRTRATKKKERTASSRAAARRRRDTAFSDSFLFPAVVLVRGRREAENAAFAVHGAIDRATGLLWDEDSKEHLEDLINAFRDKHGPELCQSDQAILDALERGVGIIHDYCAPGLQLFVGELFRGGLVPMIVVDTHLGSTELLALPSAKSVLVESSVLAICDDMDKGLIMASTAASLAGRMGKDDVGNLIVLWYDETIDDGAAGSEIASTLLYPLFSEFSADSIGRTRKHMLKGRKKSPHVPHSIQPKMRSSAMSASYDGVLRSLRRFGVDGYKAVLDYTLHSYRGWLERASLHATLEKLELERKSLNELLDKEDWSAIAEFERKASKLNEAIRVLKAMEIRYESVVTKRLQQELQLSQPGRIIGVECSRGSSNAQRWEQRLLEGGEIAPENLTTGSTEPSGPASSSELAERHVQPKRDSLSAAVFVALRDEGGRGAGRTSLDCRWVLVCVLADGMWTTLPMTDVVALASEDEEVVPNVDLLMVPHSATFDVDPSSAWAKCCPVDDTEKATVHRISDELIARVASADRPVLKRFQIPEFEAQKERVEKAEATYRQSPWCERDDELAELRRFRRRSAELGDEIEVLRRKQARLEERLFQRHNEETSNQSSILAVLEDCHALTILGDRTMEMTPIGALASVLPGQYPLFTAACLSLIDDFEELSPSEFAALIAAIACSGKIWSTGSGDGASGTVKAARRGEESSDDELDFSIIKEFPLQKNGNGKGSSSEEATSYQGDGMEEILPPQTKVVNDILSALQQLHRRHQADSSGEEGFLVSDIVPSRLNLRIARAAAMIASGEPWSDTVAVVQQEEGYLIREMRSLMVVMRIIGTPDANGEFTEGTRELAVKTFLSLDRWPINDRDIISTLVNNGIVEKHWNGNAYDKWWRSVRDRIMALNSLVDLGGSGEVESVEAEIVES